MMKIVVNYYPFATLLTREPIPNPPRKLVDSYPFATLLTREPMVPFATLLLIVEMMKIVVNYYPFATLLLPKVLGMIHRKVLPRI
jgi:hypothetical protein